MWRGIAALKPGRHLSDIGYEIERYVRSQGRYGIPPEYGGHGIGTEMHMDPWIANHGKPGRGPALEEGMCLAIEPMVNLGTERTPRPGRRLDRGHRRREALRALRTQRRRDT
ncbi:Methionine aminopeptidase [[Actinomadura] parvosata subsp. kistnae]|nr:Methionine aminopeptidase [Actinomadura parvosata subsp. kistnae]